MKQKLSRMIMNLLGWSIKCTEKDIAKCVICVAPHTSNWDFIFGKLGYTAMGRNTSFLMKSEWFIFPLGAFFRWMGGVPVYRSKHTSLTDQMANEFKRRDNFQIAITPEGSRSAAQNWKKGFYYIAMKAQVPIALIYLDYARREAGLMEYFYPTGDIDKDIAYIRSRYKNITACYPDKYIP